MTTKIIVDGPPRCGNTFLQQAMRISWGDKVKVLKFDHDVKKVKKELNLNTPFIAPIREPLYSCASAISFRGDLILTPEDALRKYTSYLNFLISIDPKKLVIYPFFEIIRDVDSALNDIGKFYPQLGDRVKITSSDVLNIPTQQSSNFPRKREKSLVKNINKILEPENSELLRNANNLYLEGLKKSYRKLALINK